MVKFLLHLGLLVILSNRLNQSLEGSHHVSKKAHSNELYQHLVQILPFICTDYVAIPDWGERGHRPIKCGGIDAVIIDQLDVRIDGGLYPAVGTLLLHIVLSN